ncbi:hypothetical protein Klosneuvirus_5_108 [Klosneuvirus KNV1]|uniref:Uncharacterized protein n=1 Tax=Klosneuvirus KNV1 TaxID=1977640 RepID=A0A1V0SLE1_9VIRU|nr:hypothetical protein Klosneuvirus_5_108 [Klosneuvirus KNV1]
MYFIIFLIILIITVLLYRNKTEFFVTNLVSDLSYIDPNSTYLWEDISEKEDWWNKTHGKKLYYYADYVPPYYTE